MNQGGKGKLSNRQKRRRDKRKRKPGQKAPQSPAEKPEQNVEPKTKKEHPQEPSVDPMDNITKDLAELEFEDDFADDIEQEIILQEQEKAEMESDDTPLQTSDGVTLSGKMVLDDDEEKEADKKVFRPGIDMKKKNEELDFDPSTYTTLHKLTMDWPCLSFDIVRDQLGDNRKKFPHTVYFCCGTQASSARENKVSILKVGQIYKTKFKDPDNIEADDDDDDDSDDDDDHVDADPVIVERSFKHPGCVNRLRCMPQSSNIIATWSDQARVLLWDVESHLQSFDSAVQPKRKMRPIHDFSRHPEEGFAMDWSPTEMGRFISGDCHKNIHLWEKTNAGWYVLPNPFKGHSNSVEDLQWSPVEKQVFASCSVDKTIAVWDCRDCKKPALQVKAHDADVNVISWNRLNPGLLASGSDDNSIKIWDLRHFAEGKPAAYYTWHRKPITSIEWHPTDESMLAASSEDDSISIWDLSVEADSERETRGAKVDPNAVPPQLMFLHAGQSSIKELHFHPQIPSMLMSTDSTGFNLFKPYNI